MLKKADTSMKYMFICVLINIAEFLVDSFAILYLLGKGASYAQIGIMWTLYLGTTAVSDYPTGGLSDRFGRRKIYSIGILLTSISYFFILTQYIPLLYLSYTIKGFGTSFISGSLVSWLSCDLKDNNKFKNTLAKTSLVTKTSSFILPIILLLFTTINMNYIFLISAVIHLFVGLFALLFLEENYGSQDRVVSIYKDTVNYFLKSKTLIYLTFVNIALYLFYTIFYYIWQPITNEILENIRYLPVCFGIYTLSMGISSYCIKYLHKLSVKKLTIAVMLFFALSFISFYVANNYGNIIFLLGAMILFGASGGVAFMLINVFANEHTSNDYKASILSLISSICTFANIIFQYIFGKLTDIYSLQLLIIFGIILSSILTVSLVFIREVAETVQGMNQESKN